MLKFASVFAGVVALGVAGEMAPAAVITYAFTGATTGAPSSGTADNVTAGNFSVGNVNGTVTAIGSTSVSSGYTGASGTNNIGNAHRIGALSTGASGSGYYEVTFTPASGYRISVTDFDFGVRSTSTGAQSYALRSSTDSYATDLITGSIANNSTWTFKNNTAFTLSGADNTGLTLRLYGYGGTGTPATNTINTRLDDIAIDVAAVAIPEPASLGLLALGGLTLLRRRSRA